MIHPNYIALGLLLAMGVVLTLVCGWRLRHLARLLRPEMPVGVGYAFSCASWIAVNAAPKTLRLGLAASAFFLSACAGPAPAPRPVADMLAPARAGNVQCYSPDLANKTCRSIVRYRFASGGAIFSDAQVIMQVSPTIVMRATTQMVQRDARLCGEATPADIDAAQFTIGGVPATQAQTQDLRTRTITHLAQRGHSELCAEFVPESGGFEVRAYADGARQPGFDDHVVWIRSDAGFTINEQP